jgi:hypothetical protein
MIHMKKNSEKSNKLRTVKNCEELCRTVKNCEYLQRTVKKHCEEW